MKEYIQDRVRQLVSDIQGISGDSSNPSFSHCAEVIWSHGTTADIARAAHSGGRIDELRLLAQAYTIHLDDDVQALFEWAEVINPA